MLIHDPILRFVFPERPTTVSVDATVGRTILSVDLLRRTKLHTMRAALILTAIFLSPLLTSRPAKAEVVDPLAAGAPEPFVFRSAQSVGPMNAALYVPQPTKASAPHGSNSHELVPANFQNNDQTPFVEDPSHVLPAPAATPAPNGQIATSKDPCAAVPNKPLNALGMSIAQPACKLPTDLATPCWEQINQKEGGYAAARSWPVCCYQWDATCFYHRPLYFEEINLERYGYQCGDRSCCCSCGRECCLQPVASAAHFFGTIPLLPYCMAVDCPGDHIYTLGHYRPGDCNPWRWHWPPCDPVAALSEGGDWVGLAAAIP